MLCVIQIVKGLGETLVGAYAGRALSFVTKKNDIRNPQVSSKSYTCYCNETYWVAYM